MNETLLGATELPLASSPHAAAARSAPGLAGWIREGLRAAFLLRPRVAGHEASPGVLLPIAILTALIDLVGGRLEVDGPAEFDLGAWLGPNWGIAVGALLVWALLWRAPGETDGRRATVASWMALWLVASVPPALVSRTLDIVALPDALADSALFAWGSTLALYVWSIAIVLRLGWHFGLRRSRLAMLGAGFFLVFAITAWQFPDGPWQAPADDQEEPDDPPQMQMDSQRYEARQDLLERALAGSQQARA